MRRNSASKRGAFLTVVDRVTGEQGTLLYTGTIHWDSLLRARITGGYFVAGRNASGDSYTLEFRFGRWVVVNEQTDWVA